MSRYSGNRYSGGLTVEDLRHAWSMFEEQHDGGRYLPKAVVASLSREWHRSPASVSDVFRILRRMHSGEPKTPTEQSTLYNMTDAERHFVFTGELPQPSPYPQHLVAARSAMERDAALDAPTPDVETEGTDPDVLTEIRDLLRELVAITRNAWGGAA